MLKRFFDILASLAGLAVTLLLLPFIALAIKLDSPGSVFYRQLRVGLHGAPFPILKFRTMVVGDDGDRPISVKGDGRVTRVGKWLRRFELDELPTLLNVLMGHMSIVGPRPEIPRYVQRYTAEQRQVLSVRPGMTDPGTLRFRSEASLLPDGEHAERVYLEQILPEKLRCNLEYIDRKSVLFDLRIIFETLAMVLRHGKS